MDESRYNYGIGATISSVLESIERRVQLGTGFPVEFCINKKFVPELETVMKSIYFHAQTIDRSFLYTKCNDDQNVLFAVFVDAPEHFSGNKKEFFEHEDYSRFMTYRD